MTLALIESFASTGDFRRAVSAFTESGQKSYHRESALRTFAEHSVSVLHAPPSPHVPRVLSLSDRDMLLRRCREKFVSTADLDSVRGCLPADHTSWESAVHYVCAIARCYAKAENISGFWGILNHCLSAQ